MEHATDGESIVIKTIYSHLGKVLILHDESARREGGDQQEVDEILAIVEKKHLHIGVYELDKLCSMPLTLDAERMNATARKMMNDGARVVEI